MKASRIFSLVLLVVVLVGIFVYSRKPAPGPGESDHLGPQIVNTPPVPRPTSPDDAALRAAPAAPTDAPSELVVNLNSPAGDVKADLRLVDAVFAAYRSGTRQENPIGENVEITAALTGKNAIDYAFIPKDCPALNGKGELCDRWGTPYFFHQLSGTEMEIRSAGPDHKLWTADDVVLTPP